MIPRFGRFVKLLLCYSFRGYITGKLRLALSERLSDADIGADERTAERFRGFREVQRLGAVERHGRVSLHRRARGRADRCALRAARRRRPVKAARTRKNIRSVSPMVRSQVDDAKKI